MHKICARVSLEYQVMLRGFAMRLGTTLEQLMIRLIDEGIKSGKERANVLRLLKLLLPNPLDVVVHKHWAGTINVFDENNQIG
jgi:hypothetical protein